MYVFVFVFSVLLVLRLPCLGKRELILVLFVRLFDLCLFGFVGFLFLLGSGKGCGLWLWHSLDFSPTIFDIKLKVYRSVVLPTLLYACEPWTVYQRHAKRLNHFHISCLRKLLKIKWQDRIPDTEVLKRAGMQSIHTLLKLAQLRWTGQVTRMPDERFPKKILYGELQVGKRSHGGQKKRYMDTLRAPLKDFSIPTESWEQIAQDRTKWRGLIKRRAGEYESKRISKAEQKRAQRKARAKASPTELPSSDLSCSICNRQFRAKIGLISHLRTHK